MGNLIPTAGDSENFQTAPWVPLIAVM